MIISAKANRKMSYKLLPPPPPPPPKAVTLFCSERPIVHQKLTSSLNYCSYNCGATVGWGTQSEKTKQKQNKQKNRRDRTNALHNHNAKYREQKRKNETDKYSRKGPNLADNLFLNGANWETKWACPTKRVGHSFRLTWKWEAGDSSIGTPLLNFGTCSRVFRLWFLLRTCGAS